MLEGLKRVRYVLDENEHGLAFDLTWEGAIPAVLEAPQFIRQHDRVTFDTQRFAQTGCWSGTIVVGDETFEVTPDRWWGTRDRSWGVRPVGEAEPPGIDAAKGTLGAFAMWNYAPIQFADSSILYICSEQPDGSRNLVDAKRVWADPDRPIEHLGEPEHAHVFVPGTRVVASSTLSFPHAPGGPLEVKVTPMINANIGVATGYGRDPDWGHGYYQGELVVQGVDLDTERDKDRFFGIVDSASRFEIGDDVGLRPARVHVPRAVPEVRPHRHPRRRALIPVPESGLRLVPGTRRSPSTFILRGQEAQGRSSQDDAAGDERGGAPDPTLRFVWGFEGVDRYEAVDRFEVHGHPDRTAPSGRRPPPGPVAAQSPGPARPSGPRRGGGLAPWPASSRSAASPSSRAAAGPAVSTGVEHRQHRAGARTGGRQPLRQDDRRHSCLGTEQLAFHDHAHLAVFVNGAQRTVPAFIGIKPDGSCLYWLHSHTPDGVIHMESPEQRSFTLGNYFDIWGQPLSATPGRPGQGHRDRVRRRQEGHRQPARHQARRARQHPARRRQGRAVQELHVRRGPLVGRGLDGADEPACGRDVGNRRGAHYAGAGAGVAPAAAARRTALMIPW